MRAFRLLTLFFAVGTACSVLANDYYLRVDAGYSVLNDINLGLTVGRPVFPTDELYDMTLHFDSVFTGQFGVGYRFSPYIRMDATLEQYMDRDSKGRCNLRSTSVCGGQEMTTGFLNTLAYFNGYFEFNPLFKDSYYSWLHPYVGVGGGFASNIFKTIYASKNDELVFTLNRNTQGDLAWRAMAGVGFLIVDHFMLDLWYAYTNAGVAQTGTSTSPAIVARNVDVQFNEGYFGLRYLF